MYGGTYNHSFSPKIVHQKKKTRFAGLFFLTGLRPVLPPSVSGCPASPGHKGQHCQVAEQFYLFIQTPLDNRIRCNCWPFFQTPLDRRGMASLQSISTFSFKHHLTGEAWPACRAILPVHSNTTWSWHVQARHGQRAGQSWHGICISYTYVHYS